MGIAVSRWSEMQIRLLTLALLLAGLALFWNLI